MITKQSQLRGFAKKDSILIDRLIYDCDSLFSDIVVYGKKCAFCGQPAIDPFHIVTRTVFSLRWDLRNVVPSCRRCHDYWHKSGKGIEWLEDVRFDLFEYRQAHLWDLGGKKPSLSELMELKDKLINLKAKKRR